MGSKRQRRALGDTFALGVVTPTLGDRIRAAMAARNITANDIADKLGVSLPFVHGVIADRVSPPSVERCHQFAETIGEPATEVLRWRELERRRRRILSSLRRATKESGLAQLSLSR